MHKHTILRNALAFGADDAIAIAAPSAKPMTLSGFASSRKRKALWHAWREQQRSRGHRATERAGNGGGIPRRGGHATSAPLNPSYKAEEFHFYLSDLRAKLLIVEYGSTSPSIEVAEKLASRSSR